MLLFCRGICIQTRHLKDSRGLKNLRFYDPWTNRQIGPRWNNSDWSIYETLAIMRCSCGQVKKTSYTKSVASAILLNRREWKAGKKWTGFMRRRSEHGALIGRLEDWGARFQVQRRSSVTAGSEFVPGWKIVQRAWIRTMFASQNRLSYLVLIR